MIVFPKIIKRQASTAIVTWADGTDAEIADMIAAADAGQIDLGDYWSVGDERIFHHSAMAATGVGESHAAQDQTWVLMDTGENSGYVFADDTPVNYVVGMKDCFDERGYMNSTETNTGSWNSCQRRTWCNNVLRNSLDADTQALFKQFKTVTASENNSNTLKTSLDYFALFAEKEVYDRRYSVAAEANALSKIEYYETSNNRIKQKSGSDVTWQFRSPRNGNSGQYCCGDSRGYSNYAYAYSPLDISPFGCI